MSDIGGSVPPSDSSTPQVIKIRRRTKILPQVSVPGIESEVLRLRKRVRPSEWDDSYASARPPRHNKSARYNQRRPIPTRRPPPRRPTPVASIIGAAMVAAAVVGLLLVGYFYLSKSGPFAVAQVQVPLLPTPSPVVAGGPIGVTQIANTSPSKRPQG